jgi:hypothetical protein
LKHRLDAARKTEFKFVKKRSRASHHFFNTSPVNHGLGVKKVPRIKGQSQMIVLQRFHEATMLKSFFLRHSSEDQTEQTLELANIILMNRVVQVIQTTARNQEKYSTLTNLRPLNS